jgi:hypothetical protein
MVVEQHRSGWPHLNVLAVCPALARDRREHYRRRRECGGTKRQAILVDSSGAIDLARHVVGAGFGIQSSCEAAQSHEKLASYFAGLSDEPLGATSKRGDMQIDPGYVDGAAAEISKLIQTPTAAPSGFRRLRSGVGFLPKRLKRQGWTGVLVGRNGRVIRRREKPWCDRCHKAQHAEPLHGPKAVRCTCKDSARRWSRKHGEASRRRPRGNRNGYVLDAAGGRVYQWNDPAADAPSPMRGPPL